jgi:two-component system, LytTR family, response regulator LytT
MKIVIIEDEKITANDLKKTLLSIEPDIEITAMLTSVEDSIDYFKSNAAPDLIFSDIQLGDGLSFEIFKALDSHIPIIFCTAYDTYFPEAFETTGIDYVLKPFSKATIEKALMKYQHFEKQFSRSKEDFQSLLGLLEARLYPSRKAVIVRHRDKIIPIEVADVALFYLENGCTTFFPGQPPVPCKPQSGKGRHSFF